MSAPATMPRRRPQFQLRFGLGPVFAVESKLNARRWQVYAGRAAFVLILLLGMTFIWLGRSELTSTPTVANTPTLQQMAEVGEGFFYALTGIQLSLILLVAPATAAGAMGMDRARGTLLQMLVTDLSDGEIVLGTLAARLTPVTSMILCGVPVTALAALLGGIDFGALAGAFVVSMSLALLGCVLALTLSVWVTKTYEVLMVVYLAEGLWLLALPIWWDLSSGSPLLGPPAWFQKANPYALAFAPYDQPGLAGPADFAAFAGGAVLLSAVLVALAIARLRSVVVDQSGRPARTSRRRWPDLKTIFPSWPSPTLEGNPLLWREWHRNRPSRLVRRLWLGLQVVAWSLAAWGTWRSIHEGIPDGVEPLYGGLMLYVVFAFLMLSASAPTALAEERVRGSLDVLLTAPVATRSIVLAKWWGAYRAVLALLPLPLYTAVFMAVAAPERFTIPPGMTWPRRGPVTAWDRLFAATLCPADFLASGAMLVSVGLLVAVLFRRIGRAIAISVILYFLAAIVWIFLVEFSLEWIVAAFGPVNSQKWMEKNPWLGESLISFSPMAGPMGPLEVVHQWWMIPSPYRWVGFGVVILTKMSAAGLMLGLAIRMFDRRLGRVPETRTRARETEPPIENARELDTDANGGETRGVSLSSP